MSARDAKSDVLRRALRANAAGLFRNARRETINRAEALLAVVADVALLFAVLQAYGIRRMGRERVHPASPAFR